MIDRSRHPCFMQWYFFQYFILVISELKARLFEHSTKNYVGVLFCRRRLILLNRIRWRGMRQLNCFLHNPLVAVNNQTIIQQPYLRLRCQLRFTAEHVSISQLLCRWLFRSLSSVDYHFSVKYSMKNKILPLPVMSFPCWSFPLRLQCG